jgi:hypothetical protein
LYIPYLSHMRKIYFTTLVLITQLIQAQSLNYLFGEAGPGNNFYIPKASIDANNNYYTAGAADAANGLYVYLQKYDNTGTITWSKSINGTNFGCCDQMYNYGFALKNNAAYLGGLFPLTVDFDPSANSLTYTAIGNDGYVAKFDDSGNLTWAKQFGGSGDQAVHGIAVDNSNNVYVAGSFQGTIDLDPGANTVSATAGGGGSNSDLFIVKLASDGSYLSSITIPDAPVNYLFLTSQNKLLVSGRFFGTVDFDPGANTTSKTVSALFDAYLLELNTSLEFSNVIQLDGTDGEEGLTITEDANGNIFWSGELSGTSDLDLSANTSNKTTAGAEDIFICKFNASLAWQWSKSIGGTGSDRIRGLTTKSDGSILAGGILLNTVDLDPGANTANTDCFQGSAYILQLNASGDYMTSYVFGNSTSYSYLYDLDLDGNGNLWGTGTSLYGTVNFDQDGGTNNLTGFGGDRFTVKWEFSTNNIMDKQAAKLQLHPNPVKNILTIESNETEKYSIYNNNGNLIQAETSAINGQIELSNLAPGMYFITNSAGNSAKFIKE